MIEQLRVASLLSTESDLLVGSAALRLWNGAYAHQGLLHLPWPRNLSAGTRVKRPSGATGFLGLAGTSIVDLQQWQLFLPSISISSTEKKLKSNLALYINRTSYLLNRMEETRNAPTPLHLSHSLELVKHRGPASMQESRVGILLGFSEAVVDQRLQL